MCKILKWFVNKIGDFIVISLKVDCLLKYFKNNIFNGIVVNGSLSRNSKWFD